VRAYYEELWERLPAVLDPPDFELRLEFMLAHAKPGDRALDLGCGDGRFTARLAAAVTHVVGAEVAEAAIRRAVAAYPEVEFRLVPLCGEFPFGDNEFDLVWASEVIEHVADTGIWLSEIRRVLAPSGRLLVTTPNHPRLRLALGGIERYSEPLGDHLHLYTRRSLGELLDAFAFEQVDVKTVGGMPGVRRLLFAHAVR
jgi:ubiquinone/menaquinone biosynthesis C-methylase UbiE